MGYDRWNAAVNNNNGGDESLPSDIANDESEVSQTNATISSPKIKYVSYDPYWGLSNQIQELLVASIWAKFLKRTLVLPK